MRPKTSIKDKLFYLCLFSLGCFLLIHHLYFQHTMSTGDHGNNLYCFLLTAEGSHPYKDYSWYYGPLMPYYYALFYILFGVSIKSVLLGETLLKVVTGLFFFGIMRRFTKPMWSLLATICFWVGYPYFLHTYSHTGAILLSMGILYYLIQWINEERSKDLYLALGLNFLLFLVKVNFAFCALFCVLLTVFIAQRLNPKKKIAPLKIYLIYPLAIIVAAFLFYFALVKDLSPTVIRQYFPYLSTDHPHNVSVLKGVLGLWEYLFFHATKSVTTLLISIGIFIFLLRTGYMLFKKKSLDLVCSDRVFHISLIALALFSVTYLHEFMLSGVFYRIYWATPFLTLILFLGLHIGMTDMSRLLKTFIVALIISFAVNTYAIGQIKLKTSTNFLSHPRAQILVYNDQIWIDTVEKTTQFLEDELQPQETFFAFPYDTLFYFLTDRKSPSKHIILFKYVNITPEQEREIISDMEKPSVRYLVMSNRINSAETGLGSFGETHCQILFDHIDKEYERVEIFGDWVNRAQWSENYGTMIIQKKE